MTAHFRKYREEDAGNFAASSPKIENGIMLSVVIPYYVQPVAAGDIAVF